MTSRDLLHVSLCIAAVSGCIYRFNLMTVTLCLLMGIVYFRQVSYRRVMLLLCLGLPMISYFSWDAHRLLQQAHNTTYTSTNISGRLLPDDLTVDGEWLRGTCQLAGSGEKVRFIFQIHTEQAQKQWLSFDRVSQFSGQGVKTRLMPATNFNQFDPQDYFATQNITHQIKFSTLVLTQPAKKPFWQQVGDQLHNWHAQAMANAAKLPEPLGEYAQALILGAPPKAFYDQNPGVQTLGLVHLFSVSGFQVTYLLLALMAILRRLWCPQEFTVAIGIVALLAYFIFTGAPGILVRAVIAGIFRLVGALGWRRCPPEAVWAISLLGSLIYQPAILLTLGGQLSFVLTFCLLFSAQLTFWQTNLWLSLVSFVLLTAQQFTWHLLQTLANCLAIPLFSVLIVPCVLIGWLGQDVVGISRLMNVIIATFAKTVDWLAQLPGQVIIGKLPWWVTLVLLLLALMSFVPYKSMAQRARWLWLVMLLIAMVGVKYPLRGELTTFDIGQGDAALLRTPLNRSVTLIDTGGAPQFAKKKPWQQTQRNRTAGETVIVNYLHSLGISRVDNLVLTHQDTDHIGYAKVILDKLVVTRVIVPAGMQQQAAFKREIQPFLRQAQVIEVTAGAQVPNFPLAILHPTTSGQAKNEDSLALWCRLGGQNIFTAGDLDQAGEASVAAQYPKLAVDIMKLGHHGSKTATNPDVIARWQPKVVLISAGRDNRYHHPHVETLKTMQENHLASFNTQTNGMIRYSYFGEKGRFEVKVPNESATITTTNTK